MTWPQAMGMCVIYGGVIVPLVITGLREIVMNAIPRALKHGITIGIGLFIAMIGLVNAGIVGRGDPHGSAPVTLGAGGRLAGWPVPLFCVTLLLIFMLQARDIPGAILIGIVTGTVLAVTVNAVGHLTAADWGGSAPRLQGSAVSVPDFSLFGHAEFGGWGAVGGMTVGVIVFTLVLAGFFDAMATIIGVGTEAGLADERGRMPGLSKALFIGADALHVRDHRRCRRGCGDVHRDPGRAGEVARAGRLHVDPDRGLHRLPRPAPRRGPARGQITGGRAAIPAGSRIPCLRGPFTRSRSAMLDIAEELHRWCERGLPFAVATVVATGGSAPRPPGAALAVDGEGTAVGSVSGGCVEGAVYEVCRETLSGDGPATVLTRFGYSDEDAFAVGLTCGGVIDILVQRIDPAERPELVRALAAAAGDGAAAVARIAAGPGDLLGRAVLVRADGSHEGSLGDEERDRTAVGEVLAMLAAGRTGTVEIGADGSRCGVPLTLLVESSVPPPRLLVFGAIDFAAALARAGKFLGYRVTVCDARPVFATARRFPDADEVVVDWPHRYLDAETRAGRIDARTAVCVLTHDAKFDLPLLERALRLPVAYVGAMGSRRTHLQRLDGLREAGLQDLELARLHSPIGLDLGARTPEETALSIAAEIVADRYGGSGVSLRGAHRPIHRALAEVVPVGA
jgi:xanthine dehydrogenase accessory factor